MWPVANLGIFLLNLILHFTLDSSQLANIKYKTPQILSVPFVSCLAQVLVELCGSFLSLTKISLPTKLNPQILIHKIFPSRHNNEIHICGLVYLRKAQMKYD
jgi:hypothetical protein